MASSRAGSRRLSIVLAACLITLAAAGLPGSPLTRPAHAIGGGVEYSVTGRMNLPNPNSDTAYSGFATGETWFKGLGSDGKEYAGWLELKNVPVNGSANYTQAADSTCPLIASATPSDIPKTLYRGWLTGSASTPAATGVSYRAGDFNTGTVTAFSYSLQFQYERVGVVTTLVITTASVTITVYSVVDHTTHTVTDSGLGGGPGVMQMDYAAAYNDCHTPGGGTVNYTLTGAFGAPA